jgi:molybdenum cofactor cytidylyltransferase
VSDVAAIVLAAGLGSRFGGASKPLAAFRGKPMIRHVCEAAFASQARPVIVVLGHRGEEVAGTVQDLGAQIVPSPNFAEGLSRSLQAGFAALPEGARAAVILLADMPFVETAVIDALIAAWRRSPGAPAVVPVHEGRRGNPVLLSRALAPEIAALAGDQGAGPLLRRLPGVVELPCGQPSILRDIDTPRSLAEFEGEFGGEFGGQE